MSCGSHINKSDFYLHCQQFTVIKTLWQNNSIIISKPDKGVGEVILNRSDYINKMADFLLWTSLSYLSSLVGKLVHDYLLLVRVVDKLQRQLVIISLETFRWTVKVTPILSTLLQLRLLVGWLVFMAYQSL